MRRNDSRPLRWSASMMAMSVASRLCGRETGPRFAFLPVPAESLRNARRFYAAAAHCVNQMRRRSVATRRRLRQLHGHVLDARVLLHRIQRHVLAVAGLLEAAVRHL